MAICTVVNTEVLFSEMESRMASDGKLGLSDMNAVKAILSAALNRSTDGFVEVVGRPVYGNDLSKHDADWWKLAIKSYLESVKTGSDASVSITELWHIALHAPVDSEPTKEQAMDICRLLNGMNGWDRCSGRDVWRKA